MRNREEREGTREASPSFLPLMCFPSRFTPPARLLHRPFALDFGSPPLHLFPTAVFDDDDFDDLPLDDLEDDDFDDLADDDFDEEDFAEEDLDLDALDDDEDL